MHMVGPLTIADVRYPHLAVEAALQRPRMASTSLSMSIWEMYWFRITPLVHSYLQIPVLIVFGACEDASTCNISQDFTIAVGTLVIAGPH